MIIKVFNIINNNSTKNILLLINIKQKRWNLIINKNVGGNPQIINNNIDNKSLNLLL